MKCDQVRVGTLQSRYIQKSLDRLQKTKVFRRSEITTQQPAKNGECFYNDYHKKRKYRNEWRQWWCAYLNTYSTKHSPNANLASMHQRQRMKRHRNVQHLPLNPHLTCILINFHSHPIVSPLVGARTRRRSTIRRSSYEVQESLVGGI
jgi:hypothetical protein